MERSIGYHCFVYKTTEVRKGRGLPTPESYGHIMAELCFPETTGFCPRVRFLSPDHKGTRIAKGPQIYGLTRDCLSLMSATCKFAASFQIYVKVIISKIKCI